MSAHACPFPAPRATWALLSLLAPLGCSPKYELLRTSLEGTEVAGGATSTGSASGAPGVDGTRSPGATGVGGSSASGGDYSGGYTSGGTGYAGGGSGGYGGYGLGEACSLSGQCAFGTLCSDYRCQACPAAPADCLGPCEHGFQPLLLTRNGCAICECVPPSECRSDADCQNGETCYGGAQCEDACSGPACCFGNRCSRPGCEGSRPNLCLAFGCSSGESCLAACDATSCECDGAGWVCENTTGGTPVASCPQACSPR